MKTCIKWKIITPPKFGFVRVNFPQHFVSDGSSNAVYELASILKITNIKTAIIEIKREQLACTFELSLS